MNTKRYYIRFKSYIESVDPSRRYLNLSPRGFFFNTNTTVYPFKTKFTKEETEEILKTVPGKLGELLELVEVEDK